MYRVLEGFRGYLEISGTFEEVSVSLREFQSERVSEELQRRV